MLTLYTIEHTSHIVHYINYLYCQLFVHETYTVSFVHHVPDIDLYYGRVAIGIRHIVYDRSVQQLRV